MTISYKAPKTKIADLIPSWHVIDADGKTLGRLASEIAIILQGKHKSTYVPYLNTGDYVIVINAGKIRVTGNKAKQKIYYRYSGYHGGLKETSLAEVLKKSPTKALQHAVKGMLPKNTIGRRMLSRLKLNTGNTHSHVAQIRGTQKIKHPEDLTLGKSDSTLNTTSKSVSVTQKSTSPKTKSSKVGSQKNPQTKTKSDLKTPKSRQKKTTKATKESLK